MWRTRKKVRKREREDRERDGIGGTGVREIRDVL